MIAPSPSSYHQGRPVDSTFMDIFLNDSTGHVQHNLTVNTPYTIYCAAQALLDTFEYFPGATPRIAFRRTNTYRSVAPGKYSNESSRAWAARRTVYRASTVRSSWMCRVKAVREASMNAEATGPSLVVRRGRRGDHVPLRPGRGAGRGRVEGPVRRGGRPLRRRGPSCLGAAPASLKCSPC